MHRRIGPRGGSSSFSRGRARNAGSAAFSRSVVGLPLSSDGHQQLELSRSASPACVLKTQVSLDEVYTKAAGRKKTSPMETATSSALDAVKPVTKAKSLEQALTRVLSSGNIRMAMANVAEGLVTLLEPETKPFYADSALQLADNFAPVAEECPPTPVLDVTGTIPESLNGVYIRNGSNPQFLPSGGYHFFDGDGMLHAVRIKDGVPTYCCRFTQTPRYLKEKEVGHAMFPNAMGELTGLTGFARLALFLLRHALGIVDHSDGIGTANAGLVFYNGRLLAMSEDDMPYAVAISPDDGDLHTLGRYDINRGKVGTAMTAHPKIDRRTGEMFTYSYSVLHQPYLRYWRASAQGELQSRPLEIPLDAPILLHDFGVTENYVVFPDPPMVFRLSEMLAGSTPIVMDEEKVSRFGVLPKYATESSQLRWFEARTGTSCFHYFNTWEEGDEVVIIGSNNTPLANVFNDPNHLNCYLTEFRLNLATGETSERTISDWNLDMGRINDRFYGRQSRFLYMSLFGPWPKFSGIVKVDLQSWRSGSPPEVAVRKLPPGCFCSEPFFVPRTSGSEADDATAEDDGYVLSYLHNELTNVSELGIFDARSPTLEPVATIKLPSRVPYGFHGIFLSEEQLANQNPSPL